jgi:hypothetical protein
MPRAAKPRTAAVRSDGQATQGNLTPIGGGQPNGRPPRSPLVQATAAGAGATPTYGEGQDLKQAIADTPVPPGVHPVAHAARVAASRAGLINPQGQLSHPNVAPLFGPTQRPWEPVTAGAPLSQGPTNPMAAPMLQDQSIVSILQQAAQASPSPTLRALAQRAAASLNDQTPPGAIQ